MPLQSELIRRNWPGFFKPIMASLVARIWRARSNQSVTHYHAGHIRVIGLTLSKLAIGLPRSNDARDDDVGVGRLHDRLGNCQAETPRSGALHNSVKSD